MKNLNLILFTLLALISIIFIRCSDDDNNTSAVTEITYLTSGKLSMNTTLEVIIKDNSDNVYNPDNRLILSDRKTEGERCEESNCNEKANYTYESFIYYIKNAENDTLIKKKVLYNQNPALYEYNVPVRLTYTDLNIPEEGMNCTEYDFSSKIPKEVKIYTEVITKCYENELSSNSSEWFENNDQESICEGKTFTTNTITINTSHFCLN